MLLNKDVVVSDVVLMRVSKEKMNVSAQVV